MPPPPPPGGGPPPPPGKGGPPPPPPPPVKGKAAPPPPPGGKAASPAAPPPPAPGGKAAAPPPPPPPGKTAPPPTPPTPGKGGPAPPPPPSGKAKVAPPPPPGGKAPAPPSPAAPPPPAAKAPAKGAPPPPPGKAASPPPPPGGKAASPAAPPPPAGKAAPPPPSPGAPPPPPGKAASPAAPPPPAGKAAAKGAPPPPSPGGGGAAPPPPPPGKAAVASPPAAPAAPAKVAPPAPKAAPPPPEKVEARSPPPPSPKVAPPPPAKVAPPAPVVPKAAPPPPEKVEAVAPVAAKAMPAPPVPAAAKAVVKPSAVVQQRLPTPHSPDDEEISALLAAAAPVSPLRVSPKSSFKGKKDVPPPPAKPPAKPYTPRAGGGVKVVPKGSEPSSPRNASDKRIMAEPSQPSPLRVNAPPRDMSPPAAIKPKARTAQASSVVSAFLPPDDTWVLDTDPRNDPARMLRLMEQERETAVMRAEKEQLLRLSATTKPPPDTAPPPPAAPEDPIEQARAEYESVARELLYLKRALAMAEAQFSDSPIDSLEACMSRVGELEEKLSVLDRLRSLRMEEYVSTHVEQALELHKASKKRAKKLQKAEVAAVQQYQAPQESVQMMQYNTTLSPRPHSELNHHIGSAYEGGGSTMLEVVVALAHPQERIGIKWTGDCRKGRVKVQSVEPDTAGARAGVVEGWRLMSINSTPMQTQHDIKFGIAQLRAQGVASFFFKRKLPRDKQLMTNEERSLRKEHKQQVKALRVEASRLRDVWDTQVAPLRSSVPHPSIQQQQQSLGAAVSFAHAPSAAYQFPVGAGRPALSSEAFTRWQQQRGGGGGGGGGGLVSRRELQQQRRAQGGGDRRGGGAGGSVQHPRYNAYMPAQHWVDDTF